MSRIGKAIDTEIRLVAEKFGGGRAVVVNECRVLGGDANVLRLIVMIVTQI